VKDLGPSGLGTAGLFLEGLKRLPEEMLPQRLFLRRREVWIAQDMDNTATLDDTVRADHLRHGHHRSDLHDRNTGLLEFGRNRSAAASGRPSRGGQDDRIDPLCLELLRDLATKPTAVSQRID
jgi:hypothetical protein